MQNGYIKLWLTCRSPLDSVNISFPLVSFIVIVDVVENGVLVTVEVPYGNILVIPIGIVTFDDV